MKYINTSYQIVDDICSSLSNAVKLKANLRKLSICMLENKLNQLNDVYDSINVNTDTMLIDDYYQYINDLLEKYKNIVYGDKNSNDGIRLHFDITGRMYIICNIDKKNRLRGNCYRIYWRLVELTEDYNKSSLHKEDDIISNSISLCNDDRKVKEDKDDYDGLFYGRLCY